MSAGLERALAGCGHPLLQEHGGEDLGHALAQALAPDGQAKLVAQEQLKPRVFRLGFECGECVRSFVVKRLPPGHARRNELVIRRWLPDLGLGGATPRLLGVSAERAGRRVWHVYEDLGVWELSARDPDPDRVAAAVRRIASVHSAFAAHPVLAECRLHGENHTLSGQNSHVRDAILGLERLRPPHLTPTDQESALRDRLLRRLHRVLAEAGSRTRALEEWGGPETLLHGDLWTTNTFVEPSAGGHRVRFIDWDRAGVGSAGYDLSTFLLRFAPEHRSWILSLYRQSLGDDGWRMPGGRELNLLFEAAECARYANRAIWPAIALLRDRAAWGFDELAAVEGWFEALRPVLPEEPS